MAASAQLSKLLDMVNKLQAACAVAGDVDKELAGLWSALPQIVCIGGQSAGKSSVLEAIIGRDCLPRGAGICTRRPLVLQLMSTAPGRPGGALVETASFLHQKGRPIDISTSADAVREEIEAETNRTLGSGKSVSSEPIMLTIRSPNVPTLTLVDMPGLTKIATDDQPKSICDDLEKMSRAYIQTPNVLIVAVSPANADIATSDAMRLVRDVDPKGDRTLGVLTKLDLMDKGTDATEVLEGRSLFLKLGWVGLRLRSQADIVAKANLQSSREAERAFFASRPEYRNLRTGTDELVSTLQKLLERAVRSAVPRIQHHISAASRSVEAELRALGGEAPQDRGGRLHTALSVLDAFQRSFEAHLEGGHGGGERLRVIFERTLPQALSALPLASIFSLRAIHEVINAADGIQPHLLAPELGMRRLVREGVAVLRPPAEAVVDQVHTALSDIVASTVAEVVRNKPELGRYSALREAVEATAAAKLEEVREEGRRMVLALVGMEGAYFTASFFREAQAAAVAQLAAEAAESGPPAEAGASQDGPPKPARKAPPPPSTEGFSPDAEAHLRRISTTVYAYVSQVSAGLSRSVPKAVVYTQVHAAKAGLLQPLYQSLGSLADDQLQALLGEERAATEARRSAAHRLKALRRAREEVNAALL